MAMTMFLGWATGLCFWYNLHMAKKQSKKTRMNASQIIFAVIAVLMILSMLVSAIRF